MLDVLLTGSLSFLITFLAIPAIIKIAQEKKLYDVPDERKLHKKPISSLGGVGIFGGFFLASLLSINNTINPEFQYFYAAAVVIFFLGVKDDILILTATKKFIGQVTAAAILIHLGGLRIGSMHGLFGINELPEIFSIALTYITIILIINAFNLIDGVDGLAGTLGLLTMAVFGSYFYMVDMTAYSMLAFAMAGSLMAFLIFNYNPAKIFMGDSGSLMLGMINSIMAIKFISVADSTLVSFRIQSAVAIGIAVLMIPLLDTLRVFSIRILKGRSPFSPDRNHIHHLLLDRGLNHKKVTFSCLLLNVAFIVLAFIGRDLGPTYLLGSIVLVALAFLGILVYYKKEARVVRAEKPASISPQSIKTIIPTTKVMTLNAEVPVAVKD
ncbi:MraY family glycosyltransferase [Paraflavisolibacter sp. H34]|uniref:glycosyltransferase family 4 protein n=1 Tax=Huijunlia imazamoxiresistens TaxID=3127457 RepID=UPI0030173484